LGIIPRIIQEFLATRIMIKKSLKHVKFYGGISGNEGFSMKTWRLLRIFWERDSLR